MAGAEYDAKKESVKDMFGQWLIDHRLIDDDDLAQALEDQKINGGLIGQAFVRLSILSDDVLTETFSDFLRIGHKRLLNRAGLCDNDERQRRGILQDDLLEEFFCARS